MTRPLLSVVIPTRDRPAFVARALGGLWAQTDHDFEVVVVDNATTAPCEKVVAGFPDLRLRYLVPPQPLPMHRNWEMAVAQAEGELVAVLIDKVCWAPDTVAVVRETVERFDPDLLNWWEDSYRPLDESGSQ